MTMSSIGRKRHGGWTGHAIAATGLLALATAANGQCWEAELIGEDSQQFDGLGWAVDISADGSLAIVGAIGHNTPYGGAGYLFERTSDGWRQSAKFEPPGDSNGFGTAVALRPDGRQACGLDMHGQLCIFTKSNDAWAMTQEMSLTGDISADAAFSGDGNVLLVATGSGSVAVYERFGDQWLHAQTLEGGRYFGRSIATSDNADVIAVGELHGGCMLGSATIYRRESDGWHRERVFTDNSSIECGRAVALSADGSRFLYARRRLSDRCGEVLAYRSLGTYWTHVQTIRSSDPLHEHNFGQSIDCSADGGTLAIADPTDASGVQGGGSVSLYDWSNRSYEFLFRQRPPNNATMASFGCQIELTPDGATVIGGAFLGGRGQSDLPVGTGAAYILNLADCSLDPRERGDIDRDFDVDAIDLGLLLHAYEKTDAGDVDGDGDTDQHDLGILLQHYNQML